MPQSPVLCFGMWPGIQDIRGYPTWTRIQYQNLPDKPATDLGSVTDFLWQPIYRTPYGGIYTL
eukprot:9186345-Ditylum_brightwellii.AAC.1